MKVKKTSDKKATMAKLPRKESSLRGAEKRLVLVSPNLFSIKRILVPTDFSICSRKALTYAIAFAKQFDATLVLLHVMQAYFPVPELGAVD